MKRFTSRIILCLFALSIYILIHGCVSKQNGLDSSSDGTNGALRYMGLEICREVKTDRMWQVTRGGLFPSLQEAEEYAESLELGGYNDWRLPTQDELFNLYYIYFWKNNGACVMNRKGEYWTAEDGREASPGHWITHFLCSPEHQFVNSPGKKGYVRAVRP